MSTVTDKNGSFSIFLSNSRIFTGKRGPFQIVFHRKLFQRPTQTWLVPLYKRVHVKHGSLTLAVMTSSWICMGTAEGRTKLFCRTQRASCLKVSEPGSWITFLLESSESHSHPHYYSSLSIVDPTDVIALILNGLQVSFHCQIGGEFPLKWMFSIFSCFCYGIDRSTSRWQQGIIFLSLIYFTRTLH